MKKRLLLTSLACITAIATSSAMAHTQSQARFSNINANGNLHVVILPSKKQTAYYSIRSQTSGTTDLSAFVDHHTLYLDSHGNKPIDVTVHLYRLHQLIAKDHTQVFVKPLKTQHFNLIARNHARVRLAGLIPLNHLTTSGHANVTFEWVNSKHLTVNMNDQSQATLAGRVKTLHAALSGNSNLTAQYLRSNQAWVQTTDAAQAKVLAIKSLQAYAANHSNIYYYKTPKLINRSNGQSGNILQLACRT